MRPLVTAEELTGEPDPRIFDVRWYLGNGDQGRREYQQGHLPGAVFADLEADLTGREGPGRHPLPTPSEFASSLGRWGVSPGQTVVAYDATGGTSAARLWWMFRSIGHDHSAVLDGGLAAWVAAGGPITTDLPIIEPTLYPAPSIFNGVIDRFGVEAAIGFRSLIDARAAERYRGEVEPIDPRPGHIPTAVNLPFSGNLDAHGRMRPASELSQRYAGASDDAIVSCGSGITACHAALAMVAAGLPMPALYEGSWSDWSRHPELPAATGDR